MLDRLFQQKNYDLVPAVGFNNPANHLNYYTQDRLKKLFDPSFVLGHRIPLDIYGNKYLIEYAISIAKDESMPRPIINHTTGNCFRGFSNRLRAFFKGGIPVGHITSIAVPQ